MQYLCNQDVIELNKPSVIALGNFDGVHKGHQKLLNTALDMARKKDIAAVALSFFPHPTSVLGKKPKPLITSKEERKNKILDIGMDVFIEYPFTKAFASISPEVFFTEVLMNKLKAQAIVVGRNYFFGKDKKGDSDYLKVLGRQHGIEVCVIDIVKEQGEVVSSSRIRTLISEGEMEKAEQLLGYPYCIVGEVVHGKKIGRTIGFPTVNIIPEAHRIYPPNGVYATLVDVYGQKYMGITNVGYNPTIGNTHKTIETHILNFNQDVYGEEVTIAFHHYLRTEKKFEDIISLSKQIAKDKEEGMLLLRDKLK